MPFITDANIRRLIASMDLMKVKVDYSFLEHRPMKASQLELASLYSFSLLLRDVDLFYDLHKVLLKTEDTYTWVYEGWQPALHRTKKCKNINLDFENFRIPTEIKVKGKKEIESFRVWFKKHELSLENNPKAFEMAFFHRYKFKIKANNYSHKPFKFPFDYSIESFEELNEQLIGYIRKSIITFQMGYSPTILSVHGKKTHLAYRDELYDFKDKRYSNEKIRSTLKRYYESVKKPHIDVCLNYYRLKYNPTLDFPEEFLLKVGFKKCSNCYPSEE